LAAGPCAENSYFKIHEMIAPRRQYIRARRGPRHYLREAVRHVGD
jgi:hypothetical protein